MTAPILPTQGDPRYLLLEQLDTALRYHYPRDPVVAAECCLIAAAVLVRHQGDPVEDLQDTARRGWRARHDTRLTGVPLGSAALTVALAPDVERQRCAEHLLFLAMEAQPGVRALDSAALALQVGAAWAATSLAVSEGRWLAAAGFAWERAGGWFEAVSVEGEAG